MTAVANWFNEKRDNVAAALMGDLRAVMNDDEQRQKDDRLNVGLYGGGTLSGFAPATYAKLKLPEDRIRWNVVKPVVDTATAKLAAKNPPRPMFLTNGGDWEQRERAKQLDKFVEGCFYEGNVRTLMTIMFRDAALTGTGVVKVSTRRGRVYFERIVRGHLYTDYAESMGGDPLTFYQLHYLTKDRAKQIYPKQASKIDSLGVHHAGPSHDLDWTWRVSRVGMIELVEAIHVGDERDDESEQRPGVRAVVASGVLLDYGEWIGKHPYVFFDWTPPYQGFWATGAVHDIRDVQREINQTLHRVHEGIRLHAVPRVSAEKGAGIEIRHLRGGSGASGDIIWRNMGAKPPTFFTPVAMPPEVYAYLESQYIRAFELSGVSQLTAQSKKPAGLDSGIALRVYHDIETERFATIVRAFEQAHIVLAQKTVEQARRIYADRGVYKVGSIAGRFIEQIDWKDVELEDERYHLQIWPASSLPQTPAGRLEYLTNLKNMGLVNDEQTKRLLGFADLEAEFNLDLAPMELIDRILHKMMKDGVYIVPQPFYPLDQAVLRTEATYMRAQIDTVPEDRLRLLRRFMRDLKVMATRAIQQPPVPTTAEAAGLPPVGPPAGLLVPPVLTNGTKAANLPL